MVLVYLSNHPQKNTVGNQAVNSKPENTLNELRLEKICIRMLYEINGVLPLKNAMRGNIRKVKELRGYQSTFDNYWKK